MEQLLVIPLTLKLLNYSSEKFVFLGQLSSSGEGVVSFIFEQPNIFVQGHQLIETTIWHIYSIDSFSTIRFWADNIRAILCQVTQTFSMNVVRAT